MAILFNSKCFWKMAEKNIERKKSYIQKFLFDRKRVKCIGINFNCAPVLDLFVKNSNDIIGSAFSRNPEM